MTEVDAAARIAALFTFLCVFTLVWALGQRWIRRAPR